MAILFLESGVFRKIEHIIMHGNLLVGLVMGLIFILQWVDRQGCSWGVFVIVGHLECHLVCSGRAARQSFARERCW